MGCYMKCRFIVLSLEGFIIIIISIVFVIVVIIVIVIVILFAPSVFSDCGKGAYLLDGGFGTRVPNQCV